MIDFHLRFLNKIAGDPQVLRNPLRPNEFRLVFTTKDHGLLILVATGFFGAQMRHAIDSCVATDNDTQDGE